MSASTISSQPTLWLPARPGGLPPALVGLPQAAQGEAELLALWPLLPMLASLPLPDVLPLVPPGVGQGHRAVWRHTSGHDRATTTHSGPAPRPGRFPPQYPPAGPGSSPEASLVAWPLRTRQVSTNLVVDSLDGQVGGQPVHLLGLHHDVHLLRPGSHLAPEVHAWVYCLLSTVYCLLSTVHCLSTVCLLSVY